MSTHTSGNSGTETGKFVQNQGGHTGVHSSPSSHTQDFVYSKKLTFGIQSQPLAPSPRLVIGSTLDWDLQELGSRIAVASMFQYYRLNSVKTIYYPGYYAVNDGSPSLTGTIWGASQSLYVVPWNLGINVNDVPHAGSIKGCESKIFSMNGIQVHGTGGSTDLSSPNQDVGILKCIQTNPQYGIEAKGGKCKCITVCNFYNHRF